MPPMDPYQTPSVDAARDLHRVGKLDQAMGMYEFILASEPEHAEASHLLGVAHLQKGDAGRAVELIGKAIHLDRHQAKFHNNLGNAELALGRPKDAEASFLSVLSLDPGLADARFNLGNVLQGQGRIAEAEAAYRTLLNEHPDHLASLINLGVVQQRTGRLADAEATFRRAVEVAPADVNALWNLANVLEFLNRLEEAEATTARLLEAAPENDLGILISARIDQRLGRPKEALAKLQGLASRSLDSAARISVLFETGQVLDGLERADEAFAAFRQANDLRSQTPGYRQRTGVRYLGEVERVSAWVARGAFAPSAPAWGGPAGGASAPVFFVGFPRSGTTLMEQALAAHSRLATTGERSPLAGVKADLGGIVAGAGAYPECLVALTGVRLTAARERFGSLAASFTGAERLRLVDKLPLNIVDLGLANLLFPSARVVVALRDPRDVVLSCFMQRFRPNDAMANFQDLDSTARLYAAVMGLWLDYRETLTVPWLEYRYEDLVADEAATVRRVVEFVGEGWEEGMLGHRDGVAGRFISTPSYRDVGSALYGRAVGRWRRYRAHLAPALPVLEPFVEAFGYDQA